jgi:hypothetical protein
MGPEYQVTVHEHEYQDAVHAAGEAASVPEWPGGGEEPGVPAALRHHPHLAGVVPPCCTMASPAPCRCSAPLMPLSAIL